MLGVTIAIGHGRSRRPGVPRGLPLGRFTGSERACLRLTFLLRDDFGCR